MVKQTPTTENKPKQASQTQQDAAAPQAVIQTPKPIKQEPKVDLAAMNSASASRLMHKLEDIVKGTGIDLNKGNVTHH